MPARASRLRYPLRSASKAKEEKPAEAADASGTSASRRDHFAVYAKDYQARFMLGYCSTYIFMQTFMIPGTILMSLLSGALFGVIKEAERYRKVQADSPALVSVPPREESDSFEKSEGAKAEEEEEAEEVLFDN